MPNNFHSQPGHLGLKTQAAVGTYTDPGAVAPNQGVFIRYTDGGFGANRELMIPDAEIGGNRDIPDAALGPASFGGDFNGYGRMEFLATLFQAALGGMSVDSGTALTGFLHTIGTADTTPWLSAEEQVGDVFDVARFTDVKVNTLHVECAANGYLRVTFGLIAKTKLSNQVSTLAGAMRVDTSPLILGTNLTVTYNAIDLKAKSFSFDVNNNMETDDFRLGSMTLYNIVEKRREITMGATIRPEDRTLWQQAVYGSSAATSLQGGTATKQAAVINILSYEDIPGANAGVKYNLNINVPKAAIKPFNATPSGDSVIQSDIEIQALRPAPATDILTVAIRNSYATVA